MKRKNTEIRYGVWGIVCIALFLCFMVSSAHGDDPTLRETIYGQVSGIEDTATNTWAWLGIPYAKPPVDTLRWKESQNPDAWEGVKETKAFCSECPQYAGGGTIVGNEDCLYLNIWRPRTQETDLPVYFWIHGGGNSAGTAGAEKYHGANLAGKDNMVVVTINYRLVPPPSLPGMVYLSGAQDRSFRRREK